MLNFKWNKSIVPKYLRKQNKEAARNGNSAALKKAKQNIYWQAGLALVTIVLTIVLVFAMTSAWYTNIVQTSGLVFEAEAWGFQGTITTNTETIVAGPGDDGVISLEVSNDSDSTVAVGINVSKARMASQMQQRLYFYVDTQQIRNGETMDRVYLNNQDSYTYTLFSGGKLTLKEEMHNDAQLKWQWVYDVLGYYVYGTETVVDGETTVRVTEYLRPIEYDYDEATTMLTTNDEGLTVMELKTVDGKLTPEEFLVKVSETDGYDDEIEPAYKLDGGYYPVAVEEDASGNRYGVYAYLCSYSEIEMATQFDTALGKAAAEGTLTDNYVAMLTVSAQKSKNSVVNVTSLAALTEAIELGAADVIQLSSNVTIPSDGSLTISKDQKVMLDLNNYTIVSENTAAAIKVEEGGSLTMINGTVDGTVAGTTNGLYPVGAEVTLSNVQLVGFKNGVRVADNEGTAALDSKVHLLNCSVDASEYAIVVKGNGSESDQNTQVIVEGCKITTDLVGISGNGSDNQSGTDIQIINSTITGTEGKVTTGVFHPQKGSLTVYNSTISAYTGITIKGGSVSVVGSTVSGTGAQQTPKFYTSGSADTGDGIYIETNYEGDILLEISGASKITSAHGYSLQVYKPDAPNVTIKIYSGIFDEAQPDEYIDKGSVQSGTTVSVKS